MEELKKLIETKEKELKSSAERRTEYKNAGAYEQLAQEEATFNKITEELSNLKDLAKKIEAKEAELKASADRLKEYKSVEATEQIAQENATFSKITEELSKLKSEISKNDVKKEEKTNSDVKDEELAKKIAEKEAEIKKAEKLMSNFGTPGFNGAEALEKYKKLMKELEELKNGKVKKEEKAKTIETKKKERKHYFPTKEELDEYMELRKKGLDDNSPEMKEFFNKIVKKREMDVERDENGNLKYPPVEQKTPTLPAKPIEKIPVPNKEDDKKKEDEEPKKLPDYALSIVYNGKDNTYNVSNYESILARSVFDTEEEKNNHIKEMTKIFSKPIEGINFKNKKAKINYLKNEFAEDDLKYIFGDNYNKVMKKMAKEYDPQLLVILSDLDMNYAKKYINELSKNKDEEKDKLPYKMKYNLKGMRKNHKNNKMSLFQRIRTNRMAKKNHDKGVAEYIPDDRSRAWLAIPIIGLLAAGGHAIATHDKSNDEPVKDQTPEVTDTTKPENTQKDPIGPTKPELPTDEIINAVDQVMEDTVKNNTDDLVLGSRVTLSDGVTYAEDSLQNGIKGEIGEVSWRPAGDYTIDRVAIYHNGKLLENISAEGTNVDETVRKYAEKLGVNPSEIDQKAHICVGEKHNGATGWINMEETSMQELKNNISKTYDQLQQEKAVNNQQQTQKTSQEQDHEDR